MEIDKLQEVANQAKGLKCAAHAAHILESSEVDEGIENLTLDDRVSGYEIIYICNKLLLRTHLHWLAVIRLGCKFHF